MHAGGAAPSDLRPRIRSITISSALASRWGMTYALLALRSVMLPQRIAEPHTCITVPVAPSLNWAARYASKLGGLGSSVAICGETILVGKPGDGRAGDDSGVACLYHKDAQGNWNFSRTLVADDAMADEMFGIYVALGEHLALVAARGWNRSGAVYAFQQDDSGNWHQQAKLVSATPTAGDLFGWPIAIDGDLAVVGAQGDCNGGPFQTGAAYVFQRDATGSWKQLTKLTAPDTDHFKFGRSIAVFDKTILVGAPGYANGRATVYLFRPTSTGVWKAVTELAPSGPWSDRSFGHTVAMNGRNIAVGAPLENKASGAVYLFQTDGNGIPSQIGRITLPDQRADSWFGVALAISGDVLLVGAQYGDGYDRKSGVAYLFGLNEHTTPDRACVHARRVETKRSQPPLSALFQSVPPTRNISRKGDDNATK